MNTINTNGRNGKLSLRTFGVFTIILFIAVVSTWWNTRNYYDTSEANDRAFRRLDSSLNVSSNFLIRACLEDSNHVDFKSRQLGYEKILIIYKPKIDSVMLCANRMHSYIKLLKQPLNSNNDFTEDDGFSNDFQKAKITNWSNEIAERLYDSLNLYSKLLLNILPFQMHKFNVSVPIDSANSFSRNATIWKETYFDGLTLSGLQASLAKLDYQVWLSANQMTNIIRDQWTEHLVLAENYFYFLTTQNSNYFLAGQTLEINAGLGAYVTNLRSQIFIDGQEQLVNAQGYTIYKKVITGGKGGSIPITISYKDPNTGQTKILSKQLGYTVLQPPKK